MFKRTVMVIVILSIFALSGCATSGYERTGSYGSDQHSGHMH